MISPWNILVCAIAAALAGPIWRAGAAEPTAARPPNVVMILSDDQAWTDFGFMGHDTIRTPHLDKLAAESALFPNGYVPTSLCRASLASIITGLYAHQHRICCNDPPEGIDRAKMLPFMRDAPALPRLLATAGYRSLQTGKWWEGHYSNGGFTEGMTTRGRHGEEGLVIGRQTMQPLFDFIDRSGERPFFVWYAPMMPHEPHDPPQRLLTKYRAPGRHPQLAKYYSMCEWFDETCGQLLDYLDEKKLRENTLVLFCVDNGWIQNTTNQPGVRFAPKSKRSPYDGGLRTPVLLRWPGHTKPDRYDDLVSTIDLAPTVLTAAGMKPKVQMSGINLLDAAAGKGELARDYVCGEIYEHTAVDVNEPAQSLKFRWIRQKDWKLIMPVDGDTELYNVTCDPHEQQDLTKDEPQRAADLRKLLDVWWSGK